ncbi:hypothetical protein NXS19_006993 [Fusarium pseudograminearum]|nr:hypothetical protein NXS19_006993 [Fusarium pseudograminearum]
MVTHEEEADTTLRALPTTAQRSAALKIHRLTGQFPWEIVDFCTETKWDVKLLEKFILLILNCFAGKLSRADVKRLRSAIYQQIEPKPFAKRMCLSQTDIQGAQRELKRSALQQSHPEKDETASKDPANQRKRSLSSSISSAAKRENDKETQQDGDVIETDQNDNDKAKQNLEVIEVHDSSEETLDLDQDQDHVQDSSPEHRDVEEPAVGSEDIPIGHGEVEQPIIEPNPHLKLRLVRPQYQNPHLKLRLIRPWHQGPLTERNISFIATRLQSANDKRLKDVETEYELCVRKRQKAFDATVVLIRQLGQLSSERAKIEQDLKKVDFTVEKTTASLVAYQELQAAGGGMRQISDMLDAALREAISERERDEAKASVTRLDADLKEISQRRMKLQRSGEHTFQCNIRMSIDARDEDGHLFEDLTFPLEAIAREQESPLH